MRVVVSADIPRSGPGPVPMGQHGSSWSDVTRGRHSGSDDETERVSVNEQCCILTLYGSVVESVRL